MKLNPPTKNIFWASVIIAVMGVIVYGLHLIINRVIRHSINLVSFLQPAAFLLVVVAFVLLAWGLTRKGI
jgi:hypothetical protein